MMRFIQEMKKNVYSLIIFYQLTENIWCDKCQPQSILSLYHSNVIFVKKIWSFVQELPSDHFQHFW